MKKILVDIASVVFCTFVYFLVMSLPIDNNEINCRLERQSQVTRQLKTQHRRKEHLLTTNILVCYIFEFSMFQNAMHQEAQNVAVSPKNHWDSFQDTPILYWVSWKLVTFYTQNKDIYNQVFNFSINVCCFIYHSCKMFWREMDLFN